MKGWLAARVNKIILLGKLAWIGVHAPRDWESEKDRPVIWECSLVCFTRYKLNYLWLLLTEIGEVITSTLDDSFLWKYWVTWILTGTLHLWLLKIPWYSWKSQGIITALWPNSNVRIITFCLPKFLLFQFDTVVCLTTCPEHCMLLNSWHIPP